MTQQIESLQNLVYNINNSYDTIGIQSAFDTVNGITLSTDEISILSDTVMFFIENGVSGNKDFVLSILNGFISKNLNNTFYIEYYNIRIMNPELGVYTTYLTGIVSKTITFLNNNLKTIFATILITMSNTVGDTDIKSSITTYVNTFGIPIDTDITSIKQTKINEMTAYYQNAIYNTFTSVAFNGTTVETYACDSISQMRINGEVTMAIAVLAQAAIEPLSWKNVSQVQCVPWTATQILKLGVDLHSFVTTQTNSLEALTVYINSLTTIDLVNAVIWGMVIPTTINVTTVS